MCLADALCERGTGHVFPALRGQSGVLSRKGSVHLSPAIPASMSLPLRTLTASAEALLKGSQSVT